jgi:hypothetical protein
VALLTWPGENNRGCGYLMLSPIIALVLAMIVTDLLALRPRGTGLDPALAAVCWAICLAALCVARLGIWARDTIDLWDIGKLSRSSNPRAMKTLWIYIADGNQNAVAALRDSAASWTAAEQGRLIGGSVLQNLESASAKLREPVETRGFDPGYNAWVPETYDPDGGKRAAIEEATRVLRWHLMNDEARSAPTE